MIDGVRPDYEEWSKMYELPRFGKSDVQHADYLGDGASFIYVAKVTWFQESFAAKVMHQVVNFDHEVSAMIKVCSHPRNVGFLGTVHSFDRRRKTIVMELLHCDLRHYLTIRRERGGRNSCGDGPLPFHVAVDIMLQVAEGIEGFHKVRLCHRDVKSGNVLV